MQRKLISVLLCAFALLLLMGAGPAPEQEAAMLAEEESAVLDGQALSAEAEGAVEPEPDAAEDPTQALEPGTVSQDIMMEDTESTADTEDTVPADASVDGAGAGEPAPEEAVPQVDESILVDGMGVSVQLGKFYRDGVTYVSLAAMAKELDPAVQAEWDESSQTATLKTDKLEIVAKVGQLYLVANGRYLYLEDTVQYVEGRVTVPLRAVVKAFDAQLSWDAETGTVTITRGSGAVQPGDDYYNMEDLFWLSRIIHAESGNQPLEGQMAVGNVVLNRVSSSLFPNTVQEVLAQKNQFSPYRNGKLADRTPNASSEIAAKLVLDGGVVKETEGALWFDGRPNSWAARNKEFVATIGGHSFYR